jgi:hypothetical protein
MIDMPILTALLWVVALAIPGVGLWFLGRRHLGRHKPRAPRP